MKSWNLYVGSRFFVKGQNLLPAAYDLNSYIEGGLQSERKLKIKMHMIGEGSIQAGSVQQSWKTEPSKYISKTKINLLQIIFKMPLRKVY